MLNKIKVIGMFLKKEQPENKENKIDNVNSVSQETENEADKSSPGLKSEQRNNRESWFGFGLMSWVPNGSKASLWCVAQGEVAERIKKEVSQKEVIEVQGYLRNESNGFQIIVKVVEFSKVDLNFEEIDKNNSNQVRILGKIINDLHPQKTKWDQEKLTFRLVVPREGVRLPLFYCRINDRPKEEPLIPKFTEKLKKGDVVLLEGFLQTKQEKVTKRDGTEEIVWVSSVNCRGFTFLDSDSANTFSSLDNLTTVFKKVITEIGFKPEDEA